MRHLGHQAKVRSKAKELCSRKFSLHRCRQDDADERLMCTSRLVDMRCYLELLASCRRGCHTSSGSRGRARGRPLVSAKKKKDRYPAAQRAASAWPATCFCANRQQKIDLAGRRGFAFGTVCEFLTQSCFTSEISVRPFEITFLSLRNTRRYNEEEKAGPVFDFYCLRPFVEALMGRRSSSRTDRESQAVAGWSSSHDRSSELSPVECQSSTVESSTARTVQSDKTSVLVVKWW